MDQDIKRMLTMIASFIGINFTYIVSGLLYQKLAKNSYYNVENNHYDRFHSSIGYSMTLRVIVWILSQIYCIFTLKKDEYVVINKKYSFVCGLIIVVASISFMEALYLISFPFLMMVKSSSVLQTALMGVFGTQIKDQKQKVGRNKIITSLIATFGVILFKLFDPETSFKSQILRQTQLLGFLLLLINLCADNFSSDFQAEIKYNSNPKPAQLLVEVSRWSVFISLAFSILTGDFYYTYNFISQHSSFTYEILALGILIFAGQAFINKLIQNFERKVASVILGSKKFFTVFLNLIHFGHRTSYVQLFGIFVAFSATIWQYLQILIRNLGKQRVKQPQTQFNNFLIQSSFEALPNKEYQGQNGCQRLDNPQNSLNSCDQQKQFVLRQA